MFIFRHCPQSAKMVNRYFPMVTRLFLCIVPTFFVIVPSSVPSKNGYFSTLSPLSPVFFAIPYGKKRIYIIKFLYAHYICQKSGDTGDNGYFSTFSVGTKVGTKRGHDRGLKQTINCRFRFVHFGKTLRFFVVKQL